VRSDDLAQVCIRIAGRRVLQDTASFRLARSMQLDERGGRAIAAPQTRDSLDLHARCAAELGGNLLEESQEIGRTAQVARQVAANKNQSGRRRLKPKMGEERRDFVDAVQWDIDPR
jgi:hypothetical protein